MTDLAQIASDLNAGQPPRVWSLLVTVFGDLAQDDGAEISAALLGEVTERLGVRPEAMRVALHRLRKDGWISSRRAGRASLYQLTATARAETRAASARIYDFPHPPGSAWMNIAKPGSTPNWPDMGVQVAPNLLVTHVPVERSDCMSIPIDCGTPPPVWLAERMIEAEVLALSRAIARTLNVLPGASELTPLEVATLRVAVIHAWRRVALRAPDLPDALFPQDWRGPACRVGVAAFLASYPGPPVSDLEI